MGMGGLWDESCTHGASNLSLLKSHDVAVKRIVLAAVQCTQETSEGVLSLTGEGELEVRACLEELLREYEREMCSQQALCIAAERQHSRRMEGLQQTRSALVDREILHQSMEAKENIKPAHELGGCKGHGAHEAEVERRLCERERAVALREVRVKEAVRANEERAQDLEVLQMRLREQGEQQSAASNDLAHRQAKLHSQVAVCEEQERQLTEARKEQGLKEQQLSELATRLAEQQELLPQSNAAEEKEQDLSVLEFRLAEREEALATREASAVDLRARLGAEEKLLQERENGIFYREGALATKEASVADLQARLGTEEKLLQERETAIFHREAAMVQREGEVDMLVHNAVAREQDALSAREAVVAREASAATLRVKLGKEERLLQERETALLHREDAIVQREDEVAQREADMEFLAQQFAGREQVLSDKEHAVATRLAKIEAARRELDAAEHAVVLREQAVGECEETLHQKELAANQAETRAEQLQARLIEMERSLEKHGRAQAEADHQLRDRERRLMKSEEEMSQLRIEREWTQEERDRTHMRREETLHMREETLRSREEALRLREDCSVVARGDVDLLQQRLLEVASAQHEAAEATGTGTGVRRKRLTARKQIGGACNSPVVGGHHSTPSDSSQPGQWTFAAAPPGDSVEEGASTDAASMEAAAVAARISLLGKRGRAHPAGAQLPWAGLATKRHDGAPLQPRSTSL